MTTEHPPLVLASSSPFRRDLLTRLGLLFLCDSPDIDETRHGGEAPEALVQRLALEKARAVATRHPGALIIGSDQVAVLANGTILGKPGSEARAIEQLQQQIQAGLPFKIDERSAELAALRTDLLNGSVQSARAANRLWAFFEDEFRLTRENALHNQTVEVGGERVLAEVVKIGAMALYFRTPDGRYGQAVQTGDSWRFVLSQDAAVSAQIAQLFDALRKQIRQGYFELPMLAGNGAGQ